MVAAREAISADPFELVTVDGAEAPTWIGLLLDDALILQRERQAIGAPRAGYLSQIPPAPQTRPLHLTGELVVARAEAHVELHGGIVAAGLPGPPLAASHILQRIGSRRCVGPLAERCAQA